MFQFIFVELVTGGVTAGGEPFLQEDSGEDAETDWNTDWEVVLERDTAPGWASGSPAMTLFAQEAQSADRRVHIVQ